jgi:hypothetical protein
MTGPARTRPHAVATRGWAVVALAGLVLQAMVLQGTARAAEPTPSALIDIEPIKIRLRETLVMLDQMIASVQETLRRDPEDPVANEQYQTARERRREVARLLDELERGTEKR